MKNKTNWHGNGLAITTRPVRNSADLKATMLSLVTDLRAHRITPMIANAMCNATGKALKIVEMEYKYGRVKQKPRRLELAGK